MKEEVERLEIICKKGLRRDISSWLLLTQEEESTAMLGGL